MGIAPNLGEGLFRGSFLDIGAALWNHVPGMTLAFEGAKLPWPSLTQEEAVQLVAFLYFIEYLGRPGAASAGREVFDARGCIECHTVDGGGAGPGPDFARLTQFASPLYIAQGIWNHGPAMLETLDEAGMEPPRFQEGDLANLSAFIRQKTAGPREPGLLAPGNPNRGAVLFAEKGCSHCHGADGHGGEEGPNLGEADLHRPAEEIAGLMWNHALEMNATMTKLGIEWPQLTTAELADLVAFLYFLNFSDGPGDPERGSKVFHARGCIDCHHAGNPAPPHAGPDLGGRSFSSPALVAAMWNHAPIVKKYLLNQGKRWSQLSGDDLRDLRAFFAVAE
jgi:mono/diheme cytochrome c family protein